MAGPGPRPSAVVLVLHGGRADSTEPVRRNQLAVLRLELLARTLAPALRRAGAVTYVLRFGVRGWNGALASPVADAVWALGRLRQDHPGLPVVVVGHSMGGRTALRAAGEPNVRGVVALAPWAPPGEPVAQLAGRRLVIAHGTQDRITSPPESLAYARRAQAVADGVTRYEIAGEGHGMLRRMPVWNALTRRSVADVLGTAPLPEGLGIPL